MVYATILLVYITRFIRRALILLPGVAMTYIAVKDIYPIIDHRVPAAFAIITTYIVTAYFLIPAMLRIIRILIKPKHVPLYCTTPDGFASDPINIGLAGTREQLIETMTRAGWYQADRRTLKNVFRLGVSMLFKLPYPTAPFSHLYLFGRYQDLGFELPVENNPRYRHHVRFWASTYQVDERFREHLHFWQRQHQPETPERILWIGAASLDVGIGIIRHNAQFTHMIHPDTDAERELIVAQVKATKLIQHTRTVVLDDPYRLLNRVWRGYLSSDGKMKICELKTN